MVEYALTNVALDTLAHSLVDKTTAVAVGKSDADVVGGDASSLGDEVYREDVTSDAASVVKLSDAGSLRASINIIGDIDVSADAEIQELGLFDADDAMLFRQVTEPRIVGAGQHVQLESDLEIVPQDSNV